MSNLEDKTRKEKKSSEEELRFWYNRVIACLDKNEANIKKLDFIEKYENLSKEEYDLSPWEQIYDEFKKRFKLKWN